MAEQIKQVFNDQGASERVIFVFTTDKAGLNHCASEDENLLESNCSFLGQVVQHTSYTQLPCQICLRFTLFPFSVWQEIVFQATLTCEQQTNTLSQTKLLYHNNTNRQKAVCC